MANYLRGETSLVLGGSYYTLRPSFQAMVEIEQTLGRSMLILMVEHSEGKLMLNDIAIILQFGLKAAGTVLTYTALLQLLEVTPLSDITRTIGHFFLNALGVNTNDEEEK